jgi:hypothetical protein
MYDITVPYSDTNFHDKYSGGSKAEMGTYTGTHTHVHAHSMIPKAYFSFLFLFFRKGSRLKKREDGYKDAHIHDTIGVDSVRMKL